MQPHPPPHDGPPLSAVPREARAYQGRTAGLVTRSVAAAVDAVVVLVVLVGMYAGLNGLLFLANPRGFTFLDTRLLLSLAAGWAVALVYLTGCWWLTGRTYGAHLMGLRVVSRRGGRLRFGTAFLRAVGCTLVPIGLLWCAGSNRHRSLQDLLVRTHVVYEWQPRRIAEIERRSSPQDDAPAPGSDERGGQVTRKD